MTYKGEVKNLTHQVLNVDQQEEFSNNCVLFMSGYIESIFRTSTTLKTNLQNVRENKKFFFTQNWKKWEIASVRRAWSITLCGIFVQQVQVRLDLQSNFCMYLSVCSPDWLRSCLIFRVVVHWYSMQGIIPLGLPHQWQIR